MPLDVTTQEREVSQAIEDFVAGKFVVRPEFIVDRPVRPDDEQVLGAGASAVSGGPQLHRFVFQDECAGIGQLVPKSFGRNLDRQLLRANRRTRPIIEVVADRQRPP